jgi:hypothetical protein
LLLIVSWPVAAPAVVGSNCICSVAVCAGFSVNGKLPPTVVKPAPVIAAALMVTADVPVDVSVTVWIVAVFNATLPKLRLAVLTVSCGFAATPVPLKATIAVLLVDELLPIVNCPATAPPVVGRNCICKVSDWLGFSVTGKLPATMVKLAPAIEAELTVTADVPVDVSVTAWVVAEFTVTLPKLKLAVLTVNWGFAAAVPVPLKDTTAVLFVDELLLIVNCPATAPVVVGRNCICSVTDWLGFSVTAKLPPTMAKPAPAIAAELTVTADVPVDVSVTAWVVFEFTVTLPKLKLAVLTVNCGFAAAAPVPLKATSAVLFVDELLLMVNCPANAEAVVGRNCICSVTDWLGFSVTGKLPPTMAKPPPAITAELTVTADVPADVSVTA